MANEKCIDRFRLVVVGDIITEILFFYYKQKLYTYVIIKTDFGTIQLIYHFNVFFFFFNNMSKIFLFIMVVLQILCS